jgi:cell wall-associated NlpC family hydrolase
MPGGLRERMLAYAKTLLGVPYEINLEGEERIPGSRGFGKVYPRPDFGLDCSGYVLNVLNEMGFLTELDPLLTNCNVIFSHCNRIAAADTIPGDLIFFEATFDQPGMTHIGIVTEAGGGAMISARGPKVGFDTITGFWADHFGAYGRLRTFPS